MNRNTAVRLVCTGGGSGGHIYPGISVIDYLVEQQAVTAGEILWIASDIPEDRRALSAHGIAFEAIPAGKLRRYWTWEHFTEISRVCSGWIHALRLLRHYRPQCVFSKGGYVSVPVVYAAWMLGIPVVSHESDTDPGLATRINQFVSRDVCIPFEAYRNRYRVQGRVRVTGNPLGRSRSDLDPPCLLPEEGVCILIHGGSLGSASLNSLIWDMLPAVPDEITVVHVLGTREQRIPPKRRNYHPVGYLEGSFSRVLKRSDIVISRSGAGSLWEQAAAHKAMVLLPLGRSISRGEQEENARYFQEHRSALVHSGTIDTQLVIRDILKLSQNSQLRRELGRRAAELVHSNGTARIAQYIIDVLNGGGNP